MTTARIASIVFVLLGLLGAAPPTTGYFALDRGQAKTQGYLTSQPVPGDALARKLDFWMTRGTSPAILTQYDVDMTKLMHVVIVSDDFSTFLHVHPAFLKDGHFRIEQRFPKPALYHVYADGEPRGIGQQVFRFDLPIGTAAQRAPRRLAATGIRTQAGPYTIAMDRTSILASGDAIVIVHILEHGKPAPDLHPYLGALAHAVFINGRDLSYVHVHPLPLGDSHRAGMAAMTRMDMPTPMRATATSSPNMMLHVALREPGTYKLWLQFRGGDAIRVAPFVLTAT